MHMLILTGNGTKIKINMKPYKLMQSDSMIHT